MTSREEDFYDLSLEIDQNCSLSSCLRNFRWVLVAGWPRTSSWLLIAQSFFACASTERVMQASPVQVAHVAASRATHLCANLQSI